ncbi:hypothetical protein G5I_14793 [Acromyrmex echinatior]|uniref:Uncharacterized protein n=1 Tax=Acromyrmex echinatior TaxID=103372 RepID=F4X8Q3_ACREC|nr:hypothetical protein G5I_14793 [Acromyrmex echinatior]
MDDKEEDEASHRRKGRNFRGGVTMAMHRLGSVAIANGKKAHSLDLHFLSLFSIVSFPHELPRRQLSQLSLIRPVYSEKEEEKERDGLPDGNSVTSD